MSISKTRIRARLHARRLMDRDRTDVVRLVREDREDLVSSENFWICRFPRHGLCSQSPDCPHCLKVAFSDPRTDAEIANIIIAGN